MSDADSQGLLNVAALRALVREVVAEELREGRPQFLSVADAAKMAGVSPDFIRDQIARGRLRRYQAGRVLRVERSDLVALLSRDKLAGDNTPPPAASTDPADEAVSRFLGRHGRGAATGRGQR